MLMRRGKESFIKMKKNLLMALVAMMVSHVSGFCEDKTYEVTLSDTIVTNSYEDIDDVYTITATVDGVTWLVETDSKAHISEPDFLHFGSGSYTVSFARISTSDIPGRIKSITTATYTSLKREQEPTMTITVGGTTIGELTSFAYSTDDDDDFYNTWSCFDKGEIVITLSKEKTEKNAMYFGPLTVEYNDADEYTIDEDSEDNTFETNDDAIVFLNRTFSSDYWNTLCLPFNLSKSQITSTFGKGSEIRAFTSVTDGNTLNFTEVTKIEAGVPYLFKPAKTVENPYFEDVSIISEEPPAVTYDGYSFTGVYNATELSTSDAFLNTDGYLYHPAESTNTLKGMRAYFSGVSANLAKLNISQSTETGISTVEQDDEEEDGKVYNLKGQQVSSDLSSLPEGLYIKNGKKIIVE